MSDRERETKREQKRKREEGQGLNGTEVRGIERRWQIGGALKRGEHMEVRLADLSIHTERCRGFK